MRTDSFFRVPRRRAWQLLAGSLVLASGACSRVSLPGRSGPERADAAGASTGAALLAEMHERYATRVPGTLAFSQENVVFTGSGQVKQSARVLVDPPGRMRVDFLPLSGRNGALYRDLESQTVAGGRRAAADAQPNPALLFAFTIFATEPESTARLLQALDIDVNQLHRDQFNGADAWVLGARKGDLTSNQLWVSARRLLPLRHIRREQRGGRTVVTDTRFGTFREYAGFPLATSIEVHRDGRLALRQSISRVRLNVPVPASAFDRTRWVDVPIRP